MLYTIHLTATGGKKIYIDPEDREGIYLYPGEIRKHHLEDGGTLSEEELEQIRKNCVLPRAKKRALGILVKGDKTAQALREKLTASLYDSRSVEEALAYVTDAGYVDDRRYAADYLASRRHCRSFRKIRMELSRKGVPGHILDQLFEEEGHQKSEDVEESVKKYIRRFTTLDSIAVQKTLAHFYRKGYDGAIIREVLSNLNQTQFGHNS